MKLKRILSAVAAFALCASLAGCGASASSAAESAAEPASSEAVSTVEEASPETSAESAALRVAGLKGPTTMGLVNMLTADDAADTIDFNMYGAADEVVPLLVKGDIDAAADQGDRNASIARDMLIYGIRKYIGAYAAAMNGVDVIVFTAGIGENGIEMREKVMEGFEFLGAKIDVEKNRVKGEERDISAADSKVKVLVIPTNEEIVIARDTLHLVTGK